MAFKSGKSSFLSFTFKSNKISFLFLFKYSINNLKTLISFIATNIGKFPVKHFSLIFKIILLLFA